MKLKPVDAAGFCPNRPALVFEPNVKPEVVVGAPKPVAAGLLPNKLFLTQKYYNSCHCKINMPFQSKDSDRRIPCT